ncbi:MAG: hypothetical protein WB816_08950 [Methylocystis sp.]
MTNSTDTENKYSISLRQRGGSGRGAMWQWEIHAVGKGLPVQKGVVAGTEKHAHDTAKAALAALERREAAPK